jgi:hypothetical protein
MRPFLEDEDVPVEITAEMIEAGAQAYYEIDREITEIPWDQAHVFVCDEYRKAAKIVLEAALAEGQNHPPAEEGR